MMITKRIISNDPTKKDVKQIFMKQIAVALLAAQKEMGIAVKDSVNPFFKSQYADLNAVREACMPALNKNGISVLQPTVHVDGKNFVRTVLLHESGEIFESFTEIIYSKQNDAQSQGSGITYARRYGLQSLVNIGDEDDDGDKASKKPEQIKPKELVTKPALEHFGEKFDKAKKFISEGGSMADVEKKYIVTESVKKLLIAK